MLSRLGIVTNKSTIRHTERRTTLLTNKNAGTLRTNLSKTVTRHKLIGISVRLDSSTELLGGNQVCILKIVSPKSSGLCARRGLRYRSQTIPSNTVLILTRIRIVNIKNTVVNTGLIKTLPGIIPGNGRKSHDKTS